MLLDHLRDLPAAVDRGVVVVTGYQQVLNGELASADLLDALLTTLPTEQNAALVEPFLFLAETMANAFTPVAEILQRQGAVADTALALTGRADVLTPALRTLAATATRDEHFRALEGPAGRRDRPGLADVHPQGALWATTSRTGSMPCSSVTATPTRWSG